MESEEMMESDHVNGINNPEVEHDVDMQGCDPEEQRKLMERASELENKVSNDRTDYQSYVDLIYIYLALRKLDSLRDVCYRFKEAYPLTPEIWLSWIKYEIEEAVTMVEKERIKNLFDEAVQDYLSVDVWLEYIRFCIGLMAHDNSADGVRLILERAVSACGMHVSKGVLIWQMFKEFEVTILECSTSDDGENSTSEPNDQERRITELYRRQLMIPLLTMETTLKEFDEWKNQKKLTIDVGSIYKNYETAYEKLKQRIPFEEILMNSEPGNNLEEYMKYLDFELDGENGVNDYMRIRCLFERAISEHPLDTELWSRYIRFMQNKIKIPEDVLSVFYRSIRNCPWSVKCWNAYLLALERYNRPKQSVLSVLEKALGSPFEAPDDYRNLWLSYLSYLRRQLERIAESDDNKIEHLEEIRGVVNRACDHLSSYFGDKGDPDSRLLLWLAKFEVKIGKDVENYHNAWERIMNTDRNRRSSHYWLQHIHMEKELHHEKEDKKEKNVRKLYAKALSLDTNLPELIAYDWLDYESLKGDFEKYEFCQKSVMSRLGSLRKQKNRQLEESSGKVPVKNKKDKIKESSYKSNSYKPTIDNKTSKKETKAEKNVKKLDDDKKPKVVDDENKSEQPRILFTPDATQEPKTVFLSNLAYQSTEEDIKNALKAAGTIEEVRLVKDFKGSSKGFGFVVFSNQAEAENALKMDRTPLDKRPIFISQCNVEKNTRKTGIRFGTGLEKNKLFVKGLPLSYEHKDVRAIFEPYGNLKDVRIVTFRNGFSKGLAYVDYDDEDSAAKALLKTDGLIVQDCKLEVMLSNPPDKRDKTSLIKKDYSSVNVQNQLGPVLQQVSKETEPRRHPRTQISLVPRALRVSSKTSKSSSLSSEQMDCSTDNTNASSSGQSSTAKTKPLSNDDFRKMLLGTK